MLLRAFFLRPAARAPWRLLATVAGVAAGVAAVVATVAASRAAVASLREGVVEVAGRSALEISATGGLDEDLLRKLLPLARHAVIVPIIEEVALLPELGEAVRVLGVDPMVDNSARQLDLAGETAGPAVFERLLRGEGILVPERLATRLGLQRGDDLRLSLRSRPIDLEVLGLLHPRRLGPAWDRVVVVDIALLQELVARQGRIDRVELVPRSGVRVAELERRTRELLSPGYQLRTPAERGAAGGRMVSALEFNLTALSGVSLFVGAVLVATTLATSVVQRRAVLALAVSLGASRQQLRRVVLAEAAVVGALGGTLGVALGLWAGRLALASVRATVAAMVQGTPAAVFQVPAWLAALGVLMGVGVSVAAALLPLGEAAATPPIQNLRAERPRSLDVKTRRRGMVMAATFIASAALLLRVPPVADLPVAALLASLALLGALLVSAAPILDVVTRALARLFHVGAGSSVKVAVAALLAGLQRASWAAGAVGVAVALAVAVGTMVHSFRATVADWADQTMRSDIWVRSMAAGTGLQVGRLDPEVAQVAERLFGRSAVDPFYTTTATVAGRPITLAGGAMEVVAQRGGVPFRDGRDSREVFAVTVASNAAMVNEPFSRRFGLGEGDTVRIELPGGTVERRIEGVFYDYSRHLGMVVLDRDDYLSLLPDEGPLEVAIFLPAGSDPQAAREEYRAALGGRFMVEMFLNAELRAEVLAIFDRTFAITRALQAVASAVAVLAVLTVLYTLVDERRRELAVLRAVGASRPQVAGVVVAQAGLLGLVSSLTGLATGLAVGLILVRIVNLQSFAWTLRFLPPWGALATTGIFVVAACLGAGILPAVAAARLSLREGLHEDG